MTPTRAVLRRAGAPRAWTGLLVVIGAITTLAGIALVTSASWLLAHTALVLTMSTASLVILAVRTSAVVRVVGRWCERWFGHTATFAVLTRLRVQVFSDLIPVSPTALADRGSGDLVTTIIDDVDTMQDHLLRVAVPLAVGGITITATAVLLAIAVSPVCGGVAAIGLVCASVAVPLLGRRAVTSAADAVITLRARRRALLVELLGATDELLVWGGLDDAVARVASLDADEARAQRRSAVAESLTSAASSVLVAATALLAFLVAREPALDGSIDRPFLVVAPLVVLAAAEVIGPMTSAIDHRARARASAARLVDVLDLPRRAVGTEDRTPAPGALGIELRSVRIGHPGGPVVLDDQDLVIAADRTVVLTGASGAGKSSVAAAVLRAITVERGSVSVLGCQVDGLSDTASARIVSALLQPDHLFDTTVRDNLRVAAPDADDAEMQALLRELGLDLSDRSVDTLDRAVGIDGALISGGERQRLLVARALLADPPVLVLDEPTEHLDPERRIALLDTIARRRRGRCTLLLSHDDATWTIADDVLTLDGGAIRVRDDQR